MIGVAISFFGAGAFFAWSVVYLAEGNDQKFWHYVRWLIACLIIGAIAIYIR